MQRQNRWFLRLSLGYVATLFVVSSICAQQNSGLDTSTFDRGVRFQDDLYQAVNGKWLKSVEIPTDKSNYGSFIILDDLSRERIRTIIEEAAGQKHPQGSDLQKVGDLYQSFMDESKIEQLGLKPLEADLMAIKNLKSKAELPGLLGRMRKQGVGGPIAFYVSQDDKDSTRYLAVITQSGTTLPDRDYYLENDEKSKSAREAFVKYINTIWKLRGEPESKVAQEILTLETKLAQLQWPRTELRDAEKTYNKFTIDELKSKVAGINWTAFFEGAEVGQITELNVSTPSFFEGFSQVIEETPLSVWQDYLTFHVIDDSAPFLPAAYDQAHFELHSKVLGGIPEQKPRWKRGVDLVSGAGAGDFGALGEVVGKIYVDRYFPAIAKTRMDELVKNLLKAYQQSIDELTWMTADTKVKAQEKLSKITTKIGYPTKWRDYSKLSIASDDLFGNARRSAEVEYRRMIDKLGKPIDRDEWGMTPQTVNAYYNPGMNEIVFPAAILQPPFFDAEADDAANYGGIGAVIGHEISHAFDDQGSKYDGDGNLRNWWTAADRDAFQKLTRRLVDQYNEYRPLPDRNVNGELTLGENIADLSGLSIAHKAYRLSLKGKEPPVIEQWTGDQRFFMGWSQVWRRKYRDAEMMRRLLTDPHAPSWYRANGPVINIDAFYEAFNVKPGDALFRPADQRIRIW